jgi:dethiobiotin synthetase
MPRPDRLVAVAGTATEIGKTWAGAAVAADLARRGLRVAARKPAQSFEPGEVTDADVLAASTGVDPHEVCPAHRWYGVPMAPPMAAEALGEEPFTVADLAAEITWAAGVEVGLVETAGATRSPIADDGDNVDLLAALAPDAVVIVAHAGLGTINDTRLAADVLGAWPRVVFLNRYDDGDDLHRRNRSWLAERDGLDVVTTIDALADRVLGEDMSRFASRPPG